MGISRTLRWYRCRNHQWWAWTTWIKSQEILQNEGLDEDIVEAIVLHNEMAAKMPRTSLFHHVLLEKPYQVYFAVALIYPSKISDVKVSQLLKGWRETFAAV